MFVSPKRKRGNYDFFSSFSWHLPGVGGMFMMLLWILVGTILGAFLTWACMPFLGSDVCMLISYPLMFIPAMMYAKAKSQYNSAFEDGYKINSHNTSPLGGIMAAVLVSVAVLAFNVIMDPVNAALPEMPESLEKILSDMTQGPFWINFLSVSIMAPFFEEWLCRGTVLRGLLHCKNDDGGQAGMNPYWAISISALFFAVIHMNLWQGLNAFVLGWLFGYVYYRTGSLSLTMLMHCVNNTFALIMSRILPESALNMSMWESLGAVPFLLLFALSAAYLYYFVKKMQTISLQSPQGNCDKIQE